MSLSDRMPVWFEAPADPIKVPPIPIDAHTTARGLAFSTMARARKYVIPGTTLITLHQMCEAMVPVIVGLAIDRALSVQDSRQLLVWVLVLAADFALLTCCYRFGSRISFLGMQSVQHMLRTTVTDKLLDPGTKGRSGLPGASLTIATTDVLRLSTMIAISVYPVGLLLAILFCAVILLTISWPLGLAILLGAPLLLYALDRAGGPLRRRTEYQQEHAAGAAGRAADLVTGYRVIKGLQAEATASQRYRDTSQEALDATLRAKAASGIYTGAGNLVTGLFVAALAVAAGLLALDKQLSIGQLITVVGLTQFLMAPLSDIAGLVAHFWPPGLASAERLLTVLRDQDAEQPTGAGELDEVSGTLAIDAISAGTLCDFSLRVAPGECVGVEGEGEAARALIDLLSTRTAPRSGEVTWNGERLHERDPESVRGTVLVAPHSADLFDGSIRDNVALPGCERVEQALEAAGCGEFLAAMPEGQDTVVGEGGLRLSGGQRQRVALARALAQPAAMLVLHDPTTAVDSVTEAGIAERIASARNGRSTVIVTSSPALLGACDRVVSLATSIAVTESEVSS